MEKQNGIEEQRLIPGELYLFHRTDRSCPADSSLFGVFDREDAEAIYLESSSSDFSHFQMWHQLPEDYRYSRLASRSELRDYIFNLTCFERRRERNARVVF